MFTFSPALRGALSKESEGSRPASIRIVPYGESTGPLRRIYDKYGAADDSLDHILAVHSLNPLSLEHHVVLYSHLMRGSSPLSRVQREMIAVVVSAENDCFY